MKWASARTIVDVGAHVGSFTVWAGRRAPKARILAIEPNPATFRLLMHNIQENHLEGRAMAINAAVSDFTGAGGLTIGDHSLGARLARGTQSEIPVDVQTLDVLLSSAGIVQVDMLKMDCEGMEFAILNSIERRWLDRIQVLACEYHPDPDHDVVELETVLHDAGFATRRPAQLLGILWATRG
jgi:FkbM family methyltransferase